MNIAVCLGWLKSWGLKVDTWGDMEMILCDYYFNHLNFNISFRKAVSSVVKIYDHFSDLC